jgi:hypothetical protein
VLPCAGVLHAVELVRDVAQPTCRPRAAPPERVRCPASNDRQVYAAQEMQ